MSAATVSRWRDGRLEPVDDDDPSAPLRAADSWLALDGTALALDRHRDRFLDWIPAGIDASAFWDAAMAQIPRTGAWFPRLELRGDALLLRVRAAPDLTRSARVTTRAGADPRIAPRVKGPDLELLTRLRADSGVDEVALLDADGYLAEFATSSLAWWVGDALCVTAHDIPQLEGVTLAALVTVARALSVDVIEARATPAELDGCEVWALNSLHGIRIVTEWRGGPATAEQPGRLTVWRARLDALRRPLPERVTT